MRIALFAVLPFALLAGCAGTAETKPAEAKPAAAAPAAKVPQCYSGDHGKFFSVGDKAEISGVAVVCQATSDGKNGQWMGAGHK